jgi:uncharacterized integral membrane protein
MAAQQGDRSRANWAKRIKFGAVIAVLVLGLVLLFQNNDNIKFNVLFWKPQLPPSMLLLGAFALGVVAGALALHFLSKARRG